MIEEETLQYTSASNQHLVAELRRFATLEELRRSQFYASHREELERLLNRPRVYRSGGAEPRLRSFLRVVEWNIERGSQLEGIIDALERHPVLKFADLLLINELDDGMARSGNLNVPFELGRALSAHVVFGVEYLELTKGAGAEAKLADENTASLHGNAILTRHPFSDPEVIQLPRCENNFESAERRVGGRIGILMNLDVAGRSFVVGNTHLDVVNTPRCRARQMRALLQAIDARIQARGGSGAALTGGDLNTHTFARGSRFRVMKNTATILLGSRDNLRRRLASPATREPAIRELAHFGYRTEGFNDGSATSRSIVSNLDDRGGLPWPMKWWVNRRIGPEGLLLEFRLDWLAARGLKALSAGEITDAETGVTSVDAQTFGGLSYKGSPLSDHDPIVVDLAIE